MPRGYKRLARQCDDCSRTPEDSKARFANYCANLCMDCRNIRVKVWRLANPAREKQYRAKRNTEDYRLAQRKRMKIYYDTYIRVKKKCQENLLSSIQQGICTGETKKSYRFFAGAKTVWPPKSQCQWDADDKTMTMEEWSAKEKELI